MHKESNIAVVAKRRTNQAKTTGRPLEGEETLCRLAAELEEAKARLEQAESQISELGREREKTVKEGECLREAYEQLKELDRKKDVFLSSVSHEIRTPLTSILSFAEILLTYPDEAPETKREIYSIIKMEGTRLARLINNLLDLSKIQADAVEWNFKKVEARAVIEKTVEPLRPLLLDKYLDLDCEVEDTLPVFMADEDRIIQVLTNLLGNAIKFTSKHGKIRVMANFIKGKRSGDMDGLIHISVSDTGIGILPRDIPTIFDRFKQCKNTLDDKPRGTGLGLSICKEIISRHHGNIWAESVFGKGSTFHITLPAELGIPDCTGQEVCRVPTTGRQTREG